MFSNIWLIISHLLWNSLDTLQNFLTRNRPASCFQSASDACPVLLLTSTLTGTCLGLLTPRWRNWYLLFWNQFLICSSVMSKAFASSARSSRVRYCWRENTSSRYLSCTCVKWLLFRFFLTCFFSLLALLSSLLSSVFLLPALLSTEGIKYFTITS